MKRNKIGIVCMICGAALICAALFLLLQNRREDIAAGESVQQVLPQIRQEIAVRQEVRLEARQEAAAPIIPEETHVDPYDEEAVEEAREMTEAEIDGGVYVGALFIPALGLDLPVLTEASEAALKIAPCRQFGSSKSNDLVIAGHNYRSHFGSLSKLRITDLVQFTDMDGLTTTYSVENVSVISPDAVDAVENSEWDLVLYTCTYDSQNRVMVGCLAIQ